MARIIDLSGQSFGRWTVLERGPSLSDHRGKTHARWLCRCECGATSTVYGRYLRNGKSKSCGCLKLEQLKSKLTEHGHNNRASRSPTYHSWVAMKTRCSNPNRDSWKNYGGRGITYCSEWEDFNVFLRDMGERPHGTSLDRIDPDGNYEPANCRWATRQQQNLNTRRNRDRARDRELA